MSDNGNIQTYKGEVDIRTASSAMVTIQATGTGRSGETPDQIMGGMAQAAEQQNPGSTAIAARYRSA